MISDTLEIIELKPIADEDGIVVAGWRVKGLIGVHPFEVQEGSLPELIKRIVRVCEASDDGALEGK